MKYVLGFVVAVVAIVAIMAAKAGGVGPFNNSMPVSLAAPTHLTQTNALDGYRVRRAGWTHSQAIKFSAHTNASGRLRLEVQVTHNGAQPNGKPSFTGRMGTKTVSLAVHGLRDGTYRWWARFYNGHAISRWVGFSGGQAFGVDSTPPSTPIIASVTNPVQGKVYRSPTVSFGWSSTDDKSGIAGYWYHFDSSTSNGIRPFVRTNQNQITFKGIPTGTYVMEVRAKDWAGNWSPVGKYTVKSDTTPPALTSVSFSTYNFNPNFGALGTTFSVDRPSKVRLGVYAQGNGAEVRLVTFKTTKRNETLTYWWHGRDNHSRLVPAGNYSIYIRTTDAYGNTSVKGYSGLYLMYKWIKVSLSQQRMWAYDGNNLFVTTLVTTGNKALPTPTGTFSILAKFAPFTFRSSAKPGAWDYYPPSPVRYAMMFQSSGYYIHDAPWRNAYGPGTNSQLGTPGQNYTGTHGCVNTPLGAMAQLYSWTPMGTPVKVVN
jgi:L,D-transpeptidase catalytic domain